LPRGACSNGQKPATCSTACSSPPGGQWLPGTPPPVAALGALLRSSAPAPSSAPSGQLHCSVCVSYRTCFPFPLSTRAVTMSSMLWVSLSPALLLLAVLQPMPSVPLTHFSGTVRIPYCPARVLKPHALPFESHSVPLPLTASPACLYTTVIIASPTAFFHVPDLSTALACLRSTAPARSTPATSTHALSLT